MKSFLEYLISDDTRHCIVCGERFHKDAVDIKDNILCICNACQKRTEEYKSPVSFAGRKPLKFYISAYPYKGVLKDAFKDYKFASQRAYGNFFGRLLCEKVKTFIKKEDFDFIVPVPLSKERMNERGYNQSEIMGRVLSEYYGIPCVGEALFRGRNTKRQSGLGGRDRYKNIKGAFVADRKIVSGKRILIIDDIYTMGMTMTECAKTLSEAGARMTAGITLFVAEPKALEKSYDDNYWDERIKN